MIPARSAGFYKSNMYNKKCFVKFFFLRDLRKNTIGIRTTRPGHRHPTLIAAFFGVDFWWSPSQNVNLLNVIFAFSGVEFRWSPPTNVCQMLNNMGTRGYFRGALPSSLGAPLYLYIFCYMFCCMVCCINF